MMLVSEQESPAHFPTAAGAPLPPRVQAFHGVSALILGSDLLCRPPALGSCLGLLGGYREGGRQGEAGVGWALVCLRLGVWEEGGQDKAVPRVG